MGIIEVREKREGRRSTQDLSWRRTYTRVFQVITTPETGSQTVRTGLPVAIGDVYSYGAEIDSATYCTSIEVACDEKSGKSWTATVGYSAIDPSIRPQNPLDMQPEVAWGWAQFQRAVFEDRNGDPILNSAKDYFDPPISRDDSRPILGLIRNQATFNQDLADSLRDHVNDAPWWGAAAGKVKISNITAHRVFSPEIGDYYWQATYEFAFNRDGWATKVLDQGFRQLNGAGTAQVPIFKDGVPVGSPALLDGSGHALAVSGTPVFLEFDVYPETDFSLLGFDAFYTLLTS